jgi:hypothetical protein
MPPKIRALPNPGKGAPLRSIDLRDFRGGISIPPSGDSLDILGNTVRDALNVDFDRGGGVVRRPAAIYTGLATGANLNYIGWSASLGKLYTFSPFPSHTLSHASPGGSWTGVATGVSRHPGNFNGVADAQAAAEFNDAVWFTTTSTSYVPFKWSGGSTLTSLSATNPTFQDSFSSPSGFYMPYAKSLCQHRGYMFAGATYTAAGAQEGSGTRIRWSHPNDPGSWRTNDYIDVPGRLACGLVSFDDHLLITTSSGAWRLSGYSAETFVLSQLIPNKSMFLIANGEGVAVYSSGSAGSAELWLYDGQKFTDISVDIRGLTASLYPSASFSLRGAVGGLRDPYVWLPFSNGANKGYLAKYNLVSGAWSFHRYGTADFISVATPGQTQRIHGVTVSNVGSNLLSLHHMEDFSAVADNWDTNTLNINSYFTTPWIHGGQPIQKKSWKRPELIYRASGAASFNLTTYVDYVDTAVKSMTATQAGSGSNYEVDRLQSVGPGRAISIKVTGPTATNVTWSIESLTLKYRPKPLRN